MDLQTIDSTCQVVPLRIHGKLSRVPVPIMIRDPQSFDTGGPQLPAVSIVPGLERGAVANQTKCSEALKPDEA